jgi:hypothetical protein
MASLDVRLAQSFTSTYTDAGTGACQDLSVFKPDLRRGEYRVSYYFKNSRSMPASGIPVVKEGAGSDGTALKAPLHFECEWCDRGTGAPRDGSLWKAIAPPGYIALGDAAVHMSNSGLSPGVTRPANEIDPDFRCVKRQFCIETDLGPRLWTDGGSGGVFDGCVFDIQGSTCSRVGYTPSSTQYKLKKFTGAIYKDMQLAMSVDNSTDVSQSTPATFKMRIGFTKCSGSSANISSEYTAEVAAQASVGISGIAPTGTYYSASAAVQTKMRAQLNAATSFNSDATSTNSFEYRVPVDMPARTRVELWQLVGSNGRNGGGDFTLGTKSFVIIHHNL